MLKLRALRHQISIEIEDSEGEEITVAQAREKAIEILGNRAQTLGVNWEEIDAEANWCDTKVTIKFEK
jgi:formylmethanofuran dehydrogenase subunit B